MKLLCGLGNPGEKYNDTRHNAGFMFLDYFADQEGFPEFKEEKLAWVSSKGSGENKMILIKPKTFMNLSGEAVSHYLNYYKMTPQDLCAIYDDVDLPLGSIRYREKGSAGTHNGMKSIIQHLGTEEFPRLRLGIESRGELTPEQMDISDFVLGRFSPEELDLFTAEVKEGMKMLLPN